MEEDAEQFSDDEIYQDLGDDFDLFDLNEEERAELAAFVHTHDSDSDSGEEVGRREFAVVLPQATAI